MDRHLKRLDNQSQYSVEQICSDCTRIDLRASFFPKIFRRSMPRTPLASSGFACTFALRAKQLSRPSLVPRPLPDFISQPWRKIGRRPGTNNTSRTGNGGLDSYVMWTRFHNDGNVPTQYPVSTASDRTVKAFCQQLRTLQVPSR